MPIRFDLAKLLALANDWPAYKGALTAQLFGDAPMQVAWAKVQGYRACGKRRLPQRLHDGGTAWQYLVRSEDLRRAAACRIGRGLTAEEVARFQVPTPLHVEFHKRQCRRCTPGSSGKLDVAGASPQMRSRGKGSFGRCTVWPTIQQWH